jgi:DNA-binding response OmpR family regulator
LKTTMKRILVVDDELGLADVLAATLSDVGYAVDTAANGVQGLELLAKDPPDLVILDCMMPLLDGPGMLAAMRADPSVARIPVVMMSAMPEATVRARCTSYTTFLRKPFDFDTVVGAVRACLREP